ncbi:VOC family protein [Effusibacillus lacus]|uniref:Glyoxalase n=1 Tax=Effusibacillus lacus TaxID=1348429 RepID=A0A292YL81_9BACL|nr:VOC family protein [Effusibacillus lacus]TCS75189.1 catechol 2,3-dioxygenase-like lactoylglutathione lyase family enzyme [Effusibacillus lacus]GAX89134.1 glyoxalase [Effusibacillus lacus]
MLRLQYVTVYVTDQDRALAFYRDFLGFEVKMDIGNENFRWLAVAPKNDQTHLVLLKVTPENPHYTDWSSRIGKHSGYIFYTDNIRETYEELKLKGVHFPIEPRQVDWGGFEGTFEDPDGNQFELVQAPNW